MGTKPRPKPKHLAAKLFQIRQRLGLSQAQLARQLNYKVSYGRISEYESGTREPNLMVLLSYSQLAGVHLEQIIDDRKKLFK